MRRGLVGLVAACALLTGCTKVMFMGDSITTVASPTLEAKAHEVFYITDMVATAGITTEGLLADVQAADLSTVDAVVINTGTNDVGGDKTEWQTSYDALLALVDGKCVVLTTVNTLADLIDPPIVVQAEDINTYLQTQVAAHANYRLVDWNAAVQDPAEPFTTDGFHPSAAGAAWLGDADVTAIESCGGVK